MNSIRKRRLHIYKSIAHAKVKWGSKNSKRVHPLLEVEKRESGVGGKVKREQVDLEEDSQDGEQGQHKEMSRLPYNHDQDMSSEDSSDFVDEFQKDGHCWHDSDDQQLVNTQGRAVFKKLKLNKGHLKQKNHQKGFLKEESGQQGVVEGTNNQQKIQQTMISEQDTFQPTVSTYQKRLRHYYKQQRAKGQSQVSWRGEGAIQKSIEDYIEEEQIFDRQKHQSVKKGVQFIAQTNQKHNSVVTGLSWCQKVMMTTGYDQKIRLWTLRSQEQNPERKLTLEKEVYLKDVPLTSCNYVPSQSKVYCGSLTKNYVTFDPYKLKAIFCTDGTVSREHKNFQQLRVSASGEVAIFSDKTVSLLGKHCENIGSFYAHQPILDVCFDNDIQNGRLYALTKSSVYALDVRTLGFITISKKMLGFSRMCYLPSNQLAIGSDLGLVYLYKLNQSGPLMSQRGQLPYLVTQITNLCPPSLEQSSSAASPYLMGMSKWKKNAVRLYDVDSCRVVPNWPQPLTKIGYGSVGCQNKWGGFAVGNAAGIVSVYDRL